MDEQIMVFSDRDIAYQVVYNLMDNAIKFADADGPIEIKVACDGKKAYVSIKNSGVGIPAKELPYIFDRFYKAD